MDAKMAGCLDGWADGQAEDRWTMGEQVSEGNTGRGQSAEPRARGASVLADT